MIIRAHGNGRRARKIAGPHFEDLAREWIRWYGREAGLDDTGHVGTTVVPCLEHRGHEVDVIALDRHARPRSRGARITLLGEAKSTNHLVGVADLDRLRHIRRLLATEGWDAEGAGLALFSRTGFAPDLVKAAASARAHLVDLPTMYGAPSTRSAQP